MITIQEYYTQIDDNLCTELCEHWGIQRDRNGKQYINVPIMNRESLLESIEAEVDSPWDDIEENYTQEEEKQLYEKMKKSVLESYDRTLQIRKDFMERLKKEPYEEWFE